MPDASNPRVNDAVDAWVHLMGAHSSMTRAFNARLLAAHSITVTDFEVLRRLGEAGESGMRRVDLAVAIGLTPSGVTRLLDGLHAGGMVSKRQCETDARVTWAIITPEGRNVLSAASQGHLGDLTTLFSERYSDEELAMLTEMLSRLPGTETDAAAREQ